jgi:hypothetical protein
MLQSEARSASFNIPEFYSVVAGCGSKDVLGRGVEEDLSNFPALC